MKKPLIVTIAVFFIGTEAFTQFKIRPLVGVNFANTDPPEGCDATAEVGCQFAGHALSGSKFHF